MEQAILTRMSGSSEKLSRETCRRPIEGAQFTDKDFANVLTERAGEISPSARERRRDYV